MKDDALKQADANDSSHLVLGWLRRNFSDPGALSLIIVLAIVLFLIEFFGQILAPILVSIVIAYMLHTMVVRLQSWRVPHFIAVLMVYCFFLTLFIVFLVWLLPLLSKQMLGLVARLPSAAAQAKNYLTQLMQHFPKFIAPSHLQHTMSLFQSQFSQVGHYLLSFSLATIPGLIAIVLYLVLVPVMVFFFLKDSTILIAWSSRFFPENRQAIDKVWGEVHGKIGQYIKGRVLEIIVVTVVSSVVFYFLGLSYAILLASLLGLSVIVPYIGALLATIPIIVVGLMQWGLSAHFFYLLISYIVIIFLDGNILVPLLFAETMDLHPLAIIISILLFGGIWGFWGIFFAIPLATLAKSILDIWPRSNRGSSGNTMPPLIEDKS